ncbi:MAG TPA: c-type cytochrome biogenesis protein CcmI, partial [Actinomycetota bacterium]|nr:c-type cytochrome biogenesis protein CcmI [Actinomycetota bacterium]
MTAVVIVAAAAIAAVAVAGVVRPFGRSTTLPIQPFDPLEDERAGLVQALRELDRDHELGVIPDQDYRSLRTETEARAIAVLRAIEARDGQGTLAADIKELRPPAAPGRPRTALWA